MKKHLFTILLLVSWQLISSAQNVHYNSIPNGVLFINEFMAINALFYSNSNGDYEDWIEIYNASDSPVNLAGCYITDDLQNLTGRQIPYTDALKTTAPAKGYLLLYADEETYLGVEHLPFKINNEGEQIFLVDPDGITVLDSITFGTQYRDISFGRYPDGGTNRGYSEGPTPGSANIKVYNTIVNKISIEPEAGLYAGNVTITVQPQRAGEIIRYTLDGSVPGANSLIYNTPVTINSTAVFSARSFKDGSLPSEVASKSFIINKQTSLPVISLIVNPSDLYDPVRGILVNDYDGRQWEKFAEIGYFENGILEFQLPAGLRVQGNSGPTSYDKKSLRAYFRNEYGNDQLNYSFYNNSRISRYSRLVFRSGYDDSLEPDGNGVPSNGTLIRDQLVTKLAQQIGVLAANSRYAILYLNHNYNGIYDIKESIDETFIFSHKAYEDADLIRTRFDSTEVTHGDKTEWNKLINFFTINTFTSDEKLEEAGKIIDLDDFINLYALIIGAEYVNWAYGVTFYRERSSSGLWRTVIWDADRAYNDVNWDALNDPYSDTGKYLYNLITKKLLVNESFKIRFINRISDVLNTVFLPENVKGIIDSLSGVISNEIAAEAEKWGSTKEKWQENINYLRSFAEQRPEVVTQQIKNYFNLSEEQILTISAAEGGKVKVNTIVPVLPFTGKYFSNVPVEITAIANAGYRFISWNDPSLPLNNNIKITLNSERTIRPVFEKLIDSNIELIVPKRIRSGQRLSFVVRVRDEKWNINSADQTPVLVSFGAAHSDTTIKVKRGAGSGLAEIKSSSGFVLSAGNNNSGYQEKHVEVSSLPVIEYSGSLQQGDIIWDNTADRLITSDLTIPQGSHLIIKPGTWIYLKKNVNIFSTGSITAEGAAAEPVIITSENWSEPWGGMEFTQSAADFKYCIILNGAGDPSRGNPTNDGWHTGRQHTFFGKSNSELSFDNCFFLYSQGKVFGMQDSKISVTNSLTSFVWHGGEFHRTLLYYKDSHLMNLPNDDHIYEEDIDTDGMHIDYVNPSYSQYSVIDGCYFVTGKDDAIDHHFARLKIMNCWLEDFVHEGIAASGGDTLRVFNTLALNNGQGFEAGWTEGNLSRGPIMFIDHCVAADNIVGLRIGDSYAWTYRSFMKVTNSILYNNGDNVLNYLNSTNDSLSGAIDISYSIVNDSVYNNGYKSLTGVPVFDGNYYLVPGSPGTSMGTSGNSMGRIDSAALRNSPVVINEIMYNSPDDLNSGDWIELFNPQSVPIDLSGWMLRDNDDAHSFIVPAGIIIEPGEYKVLCSDTSVFKNVYSVVAEVVGNISFGLGNEDKIRLFSPANEIADIVEYSSNNPWPAETDGQGYTLELLNFKLDNNSPDNWISSRVYGGTPASVNTLTGIKGEKNNLPVNFILKQNYPNPFNPVTTIEYAVPFSTYVEVKLYDILGREVATLVNEVKNPGNYKVIFNGSEIASGVYIYRMIAGNCSSSKKLVLTK